jgi:hypothetical protein
MNVPPELNIAMAYSTGKGIVNYLSPAFTQCFIPSVSLKGSTVTIHYSVPARVGVALENFDTNNDQTPPKDYRMVGSVDSAPPYGYTLTVSFRNNMSESDFNSLKKTLVDMRNGAFDVPSDSMTANLLSDYFESIINNLTIKSGKLMAIKQSVSPTPILELGLSNLRSQVDNITEAQSKFKDTSFDDTFGKTMLGYLSQNKAYFDKLPEGTAIVFTVGEEETTETTTSQNVLLMLMAALVVVLLIVIALLMARKGKEST